MVRAIDDEDVTRHAGSSQPFGVRHVLVVEEVVAADADPRRRRSGEVVGAGRRRLWVDVGAGGRLTETALAAIPPDEFWAVFAEAQALLRPDAVTEKN